jgi:hypothetical protein
MSFDWTERAETRQCWNRSLKILTQPAEGLASETVQPAEGLDSETAQPAEGLASGTVQPAEGLASGTVQPAEGLDSETVQPQTAVWTQCRIRSRKAKRQRRRQMVLTEHSSIVVCHSIDEDGIARTEHRLESVCRCELHSHVERSVRAADQTVRRADAQDGRSVPFVKP